MLVDDGERFHFTHALIRQTVVGDLSSPRRVRLHRQVADALERYYGSRVEHHLGELAHHFLEASTIGDPDKAVDYARRAGERAMDSLAYEQAARLYQRAIDVDERRDNTADSELRVRLFLVLGDALRKAGELHQAIGDMPAVDRMIARYFRLADEVRQPRYHSNVATWRAIRAMLSGRFAEAEQATQLALTIGEQIGNRNTRLYFVTRMIGLRREQGRPEDLAGLEVALRELEVQYPLYPSLHALHAAMLAELGEVEEARRDFDRFAATGFTGTEPDWLLIPRLVFLSAACAFLGDSRRAALLYELLLPYGRRYNTEGGCLGAASRFLGVLATTMGKWGKAAAHFEEAIELNSRIGAMPSVAHTQYAYAAMLLRRRERDDLRLARELLEAARSLYASLAMEYDVARTEELLATLSGSAEPPAAAYPAGLTGREAEVLRLLAAGRSNREIAEDLVLSVRTVERHITNLYGKIDARGKADATAFALEHGLVSPRRKG